MFKLSVIIELPYLPIVNQILEGFLPYAYKFGTIYTLTHRGFRKCSGTNKLDTKSLLLKEYLNNDYPENFFDKFFTKFMKHIRYA